MLSIKIYLVNKYCNLFTRKEGHISPRGKPRGFLCLNFMKKILSQEIFSCIWQEDEDGDWLTECGNIFILDTGTPANNEMIYCPYCGKKILEKQYYEN